MQISYFHTIFYGISALFAKYSHTITKRVGGNEQYSLPLICLLAIVSLSSMVNAWAGVVGVVAISGIYLMKGIFTPLMEDSLNRRLTSEKRASCLSIVSMGHNVLGIFLGEAAGIGFLGGVGGVLLGWSVSQVVNVLGMAYLAGQAEQTGGMSTIIASYTPAWLPVFALIFATLIGILSGLYPALRAATLVPVAPLRYE